MAEQRQYLLGGRFIFAMTGSAPISPELKAWVENLLDMHLMDGYGSTEAGMVLFDGEVQRPPVIDYKLVDVPDLGYFATDRPYPRGELLVKTENMFPGYYKRPEVTADVFDADGYYRTGDVIAEVGPDQLVYVDRRNNVLKLSQGEFVTVAKLEAVFGNSPLVRQIYVYGNSAHPYLLAVVVPTEEALARYDADGADALKPAIAESLQNVAKEAGLQSYEVPRDFIIETTPFTLENGLLTGIRKLAWPKLKQHYGERLEQLYADLAEGQANELQRTAPQRRRRAGAGDGQPGRGRPAGRGDHRPVTRRALHRSGRRLVVRVDIRQPAARDLRHRRAGGRHRQPGQRPGGHRRLHRGRAAGHQAARRSPRCTAATRARCTPATSRWTSSSTRRRWPRPPTCRGRPARCAPSC